MRSVVSVEEMRERREASGCWKGSVKNEREKEKTGMLFRETFLVN